MKSTSKLPTMTTAEALNIMRPYVYTDPTNETILNAFNTIETALMRNIDRPWHPCGYADGELLHDGSWMGGKWYEWLDRHNNREIARMKEDAQDHFFPSTKVITEENVIAYREIAGVKYE